MRFTGRLYPGFYDPKYMFKVSDAIVTSSRLSLDWDEDGKLGHLDATSNNKGLTYSGTLGDPRPDPNCRVEVKCFRAKDDALVLLGQFHDTATGDEVALLFQLSAEKKQRRE